MHAALIPNPTTLALVAAVSSKPMSVPVWLDLAAVVVGSLSGVLYAHRRKLDLVGHVGLAFLCGLGGGLLRDTVMQVGDVYMLRSNSAIAVSVATAALGFVFPRTLERHPVRLEWVDILAVALFAATGTDKALVYGLNPFACVLMGTLTAVGGGMLRDVFLGEVPQIFKPSNLYATCAIAGSAAYWLLAMLLPTNKFVALAVSLVVTVGLRRWSLHFGVTSSTDVPMPHRNGHRRS